jgi:hypothetical protein
MVKNGKRPVLVTDTHRGIYFGYLLEELEGGNAVRLERMRHCFTYNCFSGHCGVYGLATGGPGPGSRIGPPVMAKIRDVSKVVDCTVEAVERWESAKWG